MHGRSWTEFYILITNCPNIATSLANIATSFVGMKDVAMLAKDVAMLGRTLLHVKSLIATEKISKHEHNMKQFENEEIPWKIYDCSALFLLYMTGKSHKYEFVK